MWRYHMKLNIAFEKETKLEFLLYNKIFEHNSIYFSNPVQQSKRAKIGSFLVCFLNTNFENIDECADFISKYCFENYYKLHYPDHPISFKFIRYAFDSKDYKRILYHISKEEQERFIYAKEIFLKNLKLPYNVDIAGKNDDELDEDEDLFSKEDENYEVCGITLKEIYEELKQSVECYNKYLDKKIENHEKFITEYKEKNKEQYEAFMQEFEKNKKVYDNGYMEINTLIEDLTVDYTFIQYLYAIENVFYHNIPYAFTSNHVISILCIEFREFVSYPKNIIRKCKNCGKYFIPENLKATKYCNNIFENGKTCREIGKEKSYKNNLKSDKLLELYRKRYMSLASNNSHYHTENSKIKFEKYKSEGIKIKEKYLKR